MTEAEKLLSSLGLSSYTERHYHITVEFFKSGKTDGKELLDQLGEWDKNDLKIVNKFINK